MKIGDLRVFIRGGFTGKIVRVSQMWDDQVVLQIEDRCNPGKWIDFVRESRSEVERYTQPKDA